MMNLWNSRKRKLAKDLKPLKSKEREAFFNAKVQLLDVRDGERALAILNPVQAAEFGINLNDKVELRKVSGGVFVVDVMISSQVKTGNIAVYADVLDKITLIEDELVSVKLVQASATSYEAIRKKMRGEEISYDEMFAIIKDISENKLDDTMMTYYVASSFFYPTTDEEMYQTAKAMAECGVMFKYPKGEIIADKHCI